LSPGRKPNSNSLLRIKDVLKAGERLNTKERDAESYFLPALEVSVVSVPAGTHGGDFHGIVYLDHGCAALFIGDMAGHDFESLILVTSVLEYIDKSRDSLLHPHLFLRAMNRDLHKELTTVGRFFTAAFCVVDTAHNLLSYSSAGHPPALLFKSAGRTVAPVGRKALPLGFEHEISFPLVQTDFMPGDMLLLYTDGISGGRSAQKEEFGQQRLENLLIRWEGDSARASRETLAAHDQFAAHGPETDDRTIIAALRTL
jgi:sigma-B regulation protein RsbU (phosphoserine phosphatase)